MNIKNIGVMNLQIIEVIQQHLPSLPIQQAENVATKYCGQDEQNVVE